MPNTPKLESLVKQLVAVQQQAKALGLFTDDRGLLECPGCGLIEDVTCEGLLFTVRQSNLAQDTGLRFEPIDGGTFRCPACGQSVKEPLIDQDVEGESNG